MNNRFASVKFCPRVSFYAALFALCFKSPIYIISYQLRTWRLYCR